MLSLLCVAIFAGLDLSEKLPFVVVDLKLEVNDTRELDFPKANSFALLFQSLDDPVLDLVFGEVKQEHQILDCFIGNPWLRHSNK